MNEKRSIPHILFVIYTISCFMIEVIRNTVILLISNHLKYIYQEILLVNALYQVKVLLLLLLSFFFSTKNKFHIPRCTCSPQIFQIVCDFLYRHTLRCVR